MVVTREEKEARRRRSLPGTCGACTRPYSQASADAPEAERETRAQRDARIRRLLANYPAFCEYYFPHYMRRTDARHRPRDGHRTHGAPFHNAAFRGRLRPPAKFA